MASPTIRDFYKGRNILVTGGTGFMGKVLIEKLLYSVPDIGNIYVLMRPKRGKSVNQRIEDIRRLKLFERLGLKDPSALQKIKPLQGDVLFENLGLSDTEIANLSKEVSIIFHFAATLRLEAPLKDNVNMNTCGTRRALDVAKRLQNLVLFVHLSTAFCYPDYEVLEERLHAPPVDPDNVMKLIEWLDDKQLQLLTPSLLGPHPNCYTFSKRLAETLVGASYHELPVVIARPSIDIHLDIDPDNVMKLIEWLDDKQLQLLTPSLLGPHPNCYTFSKRLAETLVGASYHELPVVIARPSIVCPALKEPVPGWVDNLNGPVGLMIAAGKGVIRTMLCDGTLIAQVIPVDIAINAIIAIGMLEGTRKEKPDSIPVYNVNIGHHQPTTWADVLNFGRRYAAQCPFAWPLWYPNGDITTNPVLHEIRRVLFHLVPAYLVDLLLLVLGQKRILVRIQEKISQGLQVLQYFTMRPWSFPCKNYDSIQGQLVKEEQEIYNTNVANLDRDDYLKNCVEGGRVFCLKEDPNKIPINRTYHNFLYVLDWGFKILFWLLILSFMASWFEPVRTIFSYGEPVVKHLPFLGSAVLRNEELP